MVFDPIAFKRAFPIFAQKQNQQLVYLDNAATTQKPITVIQAITDFYTQVNANTHRASHRLANAATEMLEETRADIAKWVNAKPAEIVFCKGATEGLNLIAKGIDFDIEDEIILSSAEHHANLLPWQEVAQKYRLKINIIPHKNGIPDIAAIPSLLTAKTKVLAITLASNVLGVRLALESIKPIIKDKCLTVIDAAQAFAHETLDVTKLPGDFIVTSAHKFYGPTGIGFIYGKQKALESLKPLLVGGEMIQSVNQFDAVFAKPPQKFEAGTLPLAEIAGLRACIAFLQSQDRKAIQTHEQTLAKHLHHELLHWPEFTVISTDSDNIGIVTLAGDHLSDIALWLDEHDIAARVGFHCAQPLYQQLGCNQGLRFSIAGYTTEQDIHFSLEVISRWRSRFMTPTTQKASPLFHRNPDQNPQELLPPAQKLLQKLAEFSSWQSRYAFLMKLGAAALPNHSIRQERFKVQGCESNTWIFGTEKNRAWFFTCDSDSRIIKGLSEIIGAWFNGKTAAEIQRFDWQTQSNALGLTRHLSSSRQNGFAALVHHAILIAREC